MTQKRGLGRGLGALIPGGSTPPAEQPLRTRSHPRTSAEPGESGSSSRPVDMFFSGVPTEEQSSERTRAARGDLAGDMAREARERRAASRSTRSSRARGGVAARSVASPADAPPEASAKETTAEAPATKRAGSTTPAKPAKKTAGTKSSAKKAAAEKSAAEQAGVMKSDAAKAPTRKSPAKTSTASKASSSSSGSAKATSGSETSRAPAEKSFSGASRSSKTSESKTPDTKSSTSKAGASKGSASKRTAAKTAALRDVADDADSFPREDSPVVDVEPGNRFPARVGSTETVPTTEDAPDEPVQADDLVERDVVESDVVETGVDQVVETTRSDVAADSGDDTSAGEEADAADDGRTGLMPVPGAEFAEIPIHEIRENPRNPRTDFDDDQLDELAFSLREVGVLQPVVVRPIPVTDDGESFELVMGERRWRAARRAGLATIPAIIRATSDDDLLRDALLENLHRSQLNPLEEAAAYQQLLEDFGCTQDELAERIGRSRPQISNTLRLMRLPALVQRRLASGALSAGHARALLAIEDPRLQEELAQRVVADGLSVRETERLVSRGTEPAASRPAPRRTSYNPRVVDLTSRLANRLEAPVKIDVGKRKGRITMEFTNLDDLERLAARIGLDLGDAFRGDDD